MPYDYYDYHTSKVNGKDIFDISTTGNNAIDVLKNPAYFEREKNLKGTIVQMSPNEYFEECAKIFDSTADKQKKYAGADSEYIDHLKSVINIKQDKFPVPYIDYAREMQEGRHRMFVAGELFSFDTKFPVLVIDYADKERAKKEEQDRKNTENYNKIEKALNRAIQYEYESMQEFIDQLQYELNDVFFRTYRDDDMEFDLQLEDETLHIICAGIDFDFPLSAVKIETSDETWLDDIDEKDLLTISGQ